MKTKDAVMTILDWDRVDRAMQEAVAPYIFAIIIKTGREARRYIRMQPSESYGATTRIRRYQQERSVKIAKDVNHGAEKQLRATLTEGINGNESLPERAARIEAIMGWASIICADRIARLR
jgi:hypothetical protein